MAKNIEKTFNSLVKIQDSLLSALELLENFRDDIDGYNGEIKRVLPAHVDTLMNQIENIVEGPEQHSLDNLIKFLDQIPIGEVRAKKRTEKKDSDEETDIDLDPDLSEGSRSAILSESDESIVARYMKEELSKMKESRNSKSLPSDTDPNWSFKKLRENLIEDEEDDVEEEANTAAYLREHFSEENKYRPSSSFSFNDLQKDPLLRESMENGQFGEILNKSDIGQRAPSMRESATPLAEGEISLSDWKSISKSTGGLNGNDLIGMIRESEIVNPLKDMV